MLLTETLQVAISALIANKLRALLTMLGIVIGVGAVIAMVALGNGAQQSVKNRIAALGTTMLQVNPRRIQAQGVRSQDLKPMTMADVKLLEERATLLTAIQPQQDSRLQVQYANKNTNTDITATTSNYLLVRKYKMLAGRMFTDGEDAGKHRVAVLGHALLDQLGVENPEAIIGESIRVRGIQFDVIGVLEAKGAGGGFGDPDDQILIPLQTGRVRVFGRERLNDINVLARSEGEVPDAIAELSKIMRRAHRIRDGQQDDFQVRAQTDFLATLDETTKTFTYLLAGIATVSLLVGGIGIMNIMLVSVTERTKEIGVRKALGATRWNILLQFLIEAIVLCMLGGLVGVGAGIGGAIAMSNIFHWNTTIAPDSILLAFAFSAAVGLIFGVWPARRASTMDPIQALRYE